MSNLAKPIAGVTPRKLATSVTVIFFAVSLCLSVSAIAGLRYGLMIAIGLGYLGRISLWFCRSMAGNDFAA